MATMEPWQRLATFLPPEIAVRRSAKSDVAISLDGRAVATRVIHSAWIVSPESAEGMVEFQRRDGRPLIVTYTRSTKETRSILRAGGVSYAGADGRVFLRLDGILVDRDDRLRESHPDDWGDDGQSDAVRNPFAGLASRIPRWLVLHPSEQFTQAELRRAVDVSPSLVSRTLRALDQDGFVESSSSPTESRRRVGVRRPRRLLDRWASTPAGRPQRQHVWDLGAESADAALALIGEVAPELPERSWAIGGLAGAATIRRVVEPAEVLIWISSEALVELEALLQPAGGRRRRGAVRVAHVQDPWTLGLARQRAGLRVVDDAQLYLDCAREGERAYEAAEAIAQDAGW